MYLRFFALLRLMFCKINNNSMNTCTRFQTQPKWLLLQHLYPIAGCLRRPVGRIKGFWEHGNSAAFSSAGIIIIIIRFIIFILDHKCFQIFACFDIHSFFNTLLGTPENNERPNCSTGTNDARETDLRSGGCWLGKSSHGGRSSIIVNVLCRLASVSVNMGSNLCVVHVCVWVHNVFKYHCYSVSINKVSHFLFQNNAFSECILQVWACSKLWLILSFLYFPRKLFQSITGKIIRGETVW